MSVVSPAESRAAQIRLDALNALITDQSAYLDRLLQRRADLERSLLRQGQAA